MVIVIDTIDYERNSFSRWFRHQTLPDYKGCEQTVAPYL